MRTKRCGWTSTSTIRESSEMEIDRKTWRARVSSRRGEGRSGRAKGKAGTRGSRAQGDPRPYREAAGEGESRSRSVAEGGTREHVSPSERRRYAHFPEGSGGRRILIPCGKSSLGWRSSSVRGGGSRSRRSYARPAAPLRSSARTSLSTTSDGSLERSAAG